MWHPLAADGECYALKQVLSSRPMHFLMQFSRALLGPSLAPAFMPVLRAMAHTLC